VCVVHPMNSGIIKVFILESAKCTLPTLLSLK
jgi:hypothetical protein